MKLYRRMLVDVDGKPVIGDSRDMLGVQPKKPKQRYDVRATNGSDTVYPGEGLSTSIDPAPLPASAQGELWVIESDDLPPDLAVHQRGRNWWHHQIESAREMTLDELQSLLANTRDLWERTDGGPSP